jgi:hypothetical protein
LELIDKNKSTLPSTIQIKNQGKTVGDEEKLEVISLLEKGKQIVDICRNVRLAHSSV